MSESRARLAGAAAAFVILFAGALVAGHQASWFPSAPVYRFPKWTPLDLGMIDEEIARVGARADGGRWAILIGDSIPHGDGFGRPSESLGARLNEGIPTANLTSPSLAYVPALSLLRHSLGTDAPVIIVHINLKWVSHGWVPEKFTTLMNQIGDAGSDPWRPGAVRRRVVDASLLQQIRTKLHYRWTNFTLRDFLGRGLKGDTESLWDPESRQEAAPTYDVTDVRRLSADEAKTLAAYHRLTPADIDACAPLNDLVSAMASAPDRVVALVTPLNPEWTRVLAPGAVPGAAQRHLEAKLRAAGIRTLTVDLGTPDYHDDMHLSVAGAKRAAKEIAARL